MNKIIDKIKWSYVINLFLTMVIILLVIVGAYDGAKGIEQEDLATIEALLLGMMIKIA